jgi:hypothetical protein
MRDDRDKSGGKPPFPTCETFNHESLALNYFHLTGQEEGLAPAFFPPHFILRLDIISSGSSLSYLASLS